LLFILSSLAADASGRKGIASIEKTPKNNARAKTLAGEGDDRSLQFIRTMKA
jgi:hypothetical protein